MKYAILVEERKGETSILGRSCYATKQDAIEALKTALKDEMDITSEEDFQQTSSDYGWDFVDGEAHDEENDRYVIELEEK